MLTFDWSKKRHRWLLTGWKPEEHASKWEAMVKDSQDYLVYQLEKTKSGKVHAQCFYNVREPVSFYELQTRLGGCCSGVDIRPGDLYGCEGRCINYVTKERTSVDKAHYLGIHKGYAKFLVAQWKERTEARAKIVGK